MNKTTKKIIAICLCAALCISGAGVAFAQTAGKPERTDDTAGDTQPAKSTSTAKKAAKDETVYVLSAADGAVQRVIVSDWLQNHQQDTTLADRTELNDTEDLKGDASYTADGEGVRLWDTDGNDLYYQGDIEKELPVAMTVSYLLDGEAVTPEELAGKSGRVTIRFDYENRLFTSTTVNGKKEDLCVPFAVLTGLLLDNDSFRNVSVDGGRHINDGDHTIVVGLSFPGLQESLDLSRDTVDIPDHVELTADVTDFQMGITLSIATNQPFSDLDTDKLDEEDISGSLDELTDAMGKLIDGSDELYDGLCTLLDSCVELSDGVDELYDGAKKLDDGAGDLYDGASTLTTKLGELSTGLTTLSDSSASLNSGAKQVFTTLLSTATQQVQAAGIDIPTLTIDNYAKVLGGVISSLDDEAVYAQALAQVTATVEQSRPQITAAVTAAVRDQITTAVVESSGMTRAEYDAAVASGTLDAGVQTGIESAVAVQMESAETKTLIAQNTETQVQQAIATAMASDEVQGQLSAASSGAAAIIGLKTSLDSYNAFYLGLTEYTAGVDSAADGAKKLHSGAAELKDGASDLKDGTEELHDGVTTLYKNMPDLLDGVTELRDGSHDLYEGLCEFDEEGVQKLVELLGDDLADTIDRLRATADLSRGYRSFAGIDSGADGQVKFIYRTAEIKTAE